MVHNIRVEVGRVRLGDGRAALPGLYIQSTLVHHADGVSTLLQAYAHNSTLLSYLEYLRWLAWKEAVHAAISFSQRSASPRIVYPTVYAPPTSGYTTTASEM